MTKESPVWFITGCSTGFGKEIAKILLNKGVKVVLTARDPDKLQELVKGHENHALALKLDVNDREQAESAIKEAEKKFGTIDVLVNNAGYGYLGAIEESAEKDVRDMFDTNFFGLARMTHLVLPGMRSQKSGTIVNLSSVGGLVAFPGLGYYNATKFAVEGFSEALSKEVSPLGIKVVIVEPSGFRTDWAGRSIQHTEHPIPDYRLTAGLVKESISSKSGHQPGDPVLAAEAIIKAVESGKPPLHLLLGKDAYDLILQKLTALTQTVQQGKEIALAADAPIK